MYMIVSPKLNLSPRIVLYTVLHVVCNTNVGLTAKLCIGGSMEIESITHTCRVCGCFVLLIQDGNNNAKANTIDCFIYVFYVKIRMAPCGAKRFF